MSLFSSIHFTTGLWIITATRKDIINPTHHNEDKVGNNRIKPHCQINCGISDNINTEKILINLIRIFSTSLLIHPKALNYGQVVHNYD
jgi:hypothetical protein